MRKVKGGQVPQMGALPTSQFTLPPSPSFYLTLSPPSSLSLCLFTLVVYDVLVFTGKPVLIQMGVEPQINDGHQRECTFPTSSIETICGIKVSTVSVRPNVRCHYEPFIWKRNRGVDQRPLMFYHPLSSITQSICSQVNFTIDDLHFISTEPRSSAPFISNTINLQLYIVLCLPPIFAKPQSVFSILSFFITLLNNPPKNISFLYFYSSFSKSRLYSGTPKNNLFGWTIFLKETEFLG